MTPSTTSLLASAPTGRHFAQLHRTADSLADSVGEFIAAGLTRGESVVVIAEPQHIILFNERLKRAGLSVEQYTKIGRLVVLDAQATLDQFMRAGFPDWKIFCRVVGGLLERVQLTAGGATRAYGEMVSILWREGNEAAAVRLEEYWNDLARLYSFSLFCGYLLDGTHDGCYDGPLHEIGRTHADVIATDDDDRFQLAVDAACRDVLGNSTSMHLSLSGREDSIGEHKLPMGQRTMLWLKRNMPLIYDRVMDRARFHYEQNALA